MLLTLGLIALSVYYAWQYSKVSIDPDWAMFNLAGFTGAWWGRDFLDCKTPAIHIWYWAIAKIVGPNIARVRFVHHLLVTSPGILVGGWVGLTYIVLVNSGWLLSFHGNVGTPAAAFLLLAIYYQQPIWAVFALAFEPKLLVPVSVFYVLMGWLWQSAVIAIATGAIALAIWLTRRQWWEWMVEANLTITSRMTRMRKGIGYSWPWFTSQGYLYILPWMAFGVYYHQDWRFWAPVVAYLAFLQLGLVVRQNHLLVIVPWLAMAGVPVQITVVLLIVDVVSGGLYLGDLWQRFYPGLRNDNMEAQKIGELLRNEPGSLWVNSYHTGVYIHARKPPIGGLCEQIEIRENAQERRDRWREFFKKDPPTWVVTGPLPGWEFRPVGYDHAFSGMKFMIYGRKNGSLQ